MLLRIAPEKMSETAPMKIAEHGHRRQQLDEQEAALRRAGGRASSRYGVRCPGRTTVAMFTVAVVVAALSLTGRSDAAARTVPQPVR